MPVHVDHEALAAQAKRLATAKNELEAKLAEIQGQIQELISGGFNTESASASFGEAAERWNVAAKNTIAELETMGIYLNKTSGAFAEVDAQYTVKL